MTRIDRGGNGGEQLLVLWTWLLEGYVPVAHMVAEPEELEPELAESVHDRTSIGQPQFLRREAA